MHGDAQGVWVCVVGGVVLAGLGHQWPGRPPTRPYDFRHPHHCIIRSECSTARCFEHVTYMSGAIIRLRWMELDGVCVVRILIVGYKPHIHE